MRGPGRIPSPRPCLRQAHNNTPPPDRAPRRLATEDHPCRTPSLPIEATAAPAAALAALRAVAVRDGALPLDRRRALLLAMAAPLLRRAEDVAAALDADSAAAASRRR